MTRRPPYGDRRGTRDLLHSFLIKRRTANPNAFTSISTLTCRAILIDMVMAVDGDAGVVLVTRGGLPWEQSGGPPDIAVFTFGGGWLLGNVTITGSRAAAILGLGALVLARRRRN